MIPTRRTYNRPSYRGTHLIYELQATKELDNNVMNITMPSLNTSQKRSQCWGLNVGPHIDTDGLWPVCIEVNSDKLNVVSYRLTKVANLVQLVIRLGDMI